MGRNNRNHRVAAAEEEARRLRAVLAERMAHLGARLGIDAESILTLDAGLFGRYLLLVPFLERVLDRIEALEQRKPPDGA